MVIANELSRDTGNKTHNKDKQSRNTTRKTLEISNTGPTKIKAGVKPRCSRRVRVPVKKEYKNRLRVDS